MANNLIIEEKPGFGSKFQDINSKDLKLSDFAGKLLLINLWATWCEPCKKEMPSLDRLQKQYNKEDFHILAISIDRGPKAIQGKGGGPPLPCSHLGPRGQC